MTTEAGCILALGLAAVLIVVINDWWKYRLAKQASSQQRPIPPHWTENRTNWIRVALLVIGFIAFAIVRSHPEWTNDYEGPGNVLLHHFFPRR